VSYDVALQRIAQLQSLLTPAAAGATASTATATAPAAATDTSSSSFASTLQSFGSAGAMAASGTTAGGGTSAGLAAVRAAEGEVGQAEQPPGSNDSPRIAQYRQATAGSGVGPWCAYFVSWAARQAGAPIGDQGQGYGSVSAVMDWGRRTGRALPAGAAPQAGDLIVWGGRHVGIVESVDGNGDIHTIEGNSSDRVSRRTYGPDGGGATGYVRLG
jgi:hypothetical protein